MRQLQKVQHTNNGNRERKNRRVEEWLRIFQKLMIHQTTELGNSENTKYDKCEDKHTHTPKNKNTKPRHVIVKLLKPKTKYLERN